MRILTLMMLMVVGCGWETKMEIPLENNSTSPADQNTTKSTPEKTNTSTNSPPKLTDQNSTKPTPTKELSLREKVVGEYKVETDIYALRIVFLENGKSEGYVNGEITKRANWKLVGKEVHFFDEESSSVCKIEPNGDLTVIAQIENKKRMDFPKEEQFLWEKIK